MSSDLLNIGASGLRAYRASLAVTGDNIANAQTPGYARRSLRLNEVSITGAPDFRYRNRTRFDGVDISATIRATDEWRTGDARLAASAQGRAQANATWMVNTETALADGETGTGAAMAKMFAAGDALAADPLSRAPRSAFLASVDDAAASIRGNATELARVSAGVADAAKASVNGLNANLAALADLNLAIRRTSAGSTANAELADQRDALIDKIAGQTDVSVAIAEDGSATLTRAGGTLVAGGDAATLVLTVAPDGRLSVTQTFNATTSGFSPSGARYARDRSRHGSEQLAREWANPRQQQWRAVARCVGRCDCLDRAYHRPNPSRRHRYGWYRQRQYVRAIDGAQRQRGRRAMGRTRRQSGANHRVGARRRKPHVGAQRHRRRRARCGRRGRP
jgi:flagellar hook-associated protein 1